MKICFYKGPGTIRVGGVVIGLILLSASANRCLAEPAPVPNRGISLDSGAVADLEEKEIKSASSPPAATAPGATRNPLGRPVEGTIWAALAFVLLLIFLVAWLIRKAYPVGGRLFGSLPVLQVLGRTHLAPKQILTLVRFDRRLLLLGVADHQINLLLSIDDPEQVSQITGLIEQSRPASFTAGFKQLFHRETSEIDRQQRIESADPAKTLNKIEENEVFQLKNELNSLINKVKELKGIGSRNPSN